MDRKDKKEYLITLIKQSELPTSKLNTVKMKYEEIDLEKVADFLLDNGVDIVNPYSKLIKSCIEPIENGSMYDVDMGYINKRKTIELIANEWSGIETIKVDDIIAFIENIPNEPVEEIRLTDSIKSDGKKIEGKFIDIYCK